jgi:hypothetical protein
LLLAIAASAAAGTLKKKSSRLKPTVTAMHAMPCILNMKKFKKEACMKSAL